MGMGMKVIVYIVLALSKKVMIHQQSFLAYDMA